MRRAPAVQIGEWLRALARPGVSDGRLEATFWRRPKLETFPTVSSGPTAAKALFAVLDANIARGASLETFLTLVRPKRS